MKPPAKRPEEKALEPSKPIASALANASPESRKRNFGSDDPDFSEHLLTQIINLSSQGAKIDVKATAFAVAAIRGVKPRDTIETMLATQMVGIHNAMTTMARRLAHVDNIAQQDSAVRALNNLARTYAMQMEALKRYRDGGKQQVTVEHVTVNEGGQAIVGNVATKGNVGEK